MTTRDRETVKFGGVEVRLRNGYGLMPKGMGITQTSGRRNAKLTKAISGSVTTGLKVLHDTEEHYGSSAVARRVVDTLGNNVTAALLGVAKDRPGRWARGEDAPSEENRAGLADLDSLVGHILAVMTPAQAVLWLNGNDPILQARPLDVYRIEGPERIIHALKAFEQGAYA